MYCIDALEATVIKWNNYFTAFDFTTWLSTLGLFVLYSFLTKSFSRAIDMMLTLLETSTQYRHDPRFFCHYLIGLTFITFVYQAVVGTEFYGFESTTSVETLLSNGHKVSVGTNASLQRRLDPANLYPKQRLLYAKYKDSFIARQENYNGLLHGLISTMVNNLAATGNLRMVNSLSTTDLPFFNGNLHKINGKFYKSFPFEDYPAQFGLYSWSFLSRKAHETLMRLNSFGFLNLYRKYASWAQNLNTTEKSKIYSGKWTQTVTDPEVFGFSASMRWICVLHCCILLTIFLVVFIFYVCANRKTCVIVQTTKVVTLPEAIAMAEDILMK